MSEYVGPGIVLSRRDLTIFKEVVTNTAEDFKLLRTGEFTTTFNPASGLRNDLEDVVLKHWEVPFG